jgi:hypothetical protein
LSIGKTCVVYSVFHAPRKLRLIIDRLGQNRMSIHSFTLFHIVTSQA